MEVIAEECDQSKSSTRIVVILYLHKGTRFKDLSVVYSNSRSDLISRQSVSRSYD